MKIGEIVDQHKGRIYIALTALVVSPLLSANTVIDVGVGAAPEYPPAYGAVWALSSNCVDINEIGEAACQTRATGPTYSCGFRGAQACSSKVYQVQRWNGVALTLMSDPAATSDVPLAMNSLGDIAGYSQEEEVYPAGGSNGRIWSAPQNPDIKSSVVIDINDHGDYVLQWADSSGGVLKHDGLVYGADGEEIPYAGSLLRPFVIGNNRHAVGGQVIQSFVQDIFSPTGDEVPDVSGVGWLYREDEVDTFPLNESGLFDVDGKIYWPVLFYRPEGFTTYETTVSDINDHGDFVARMEFGGLFSGRYCMAEGESTVRDTFGVTQTVPWQCESTNYNGGTYAGGKAFVGINNIGDAVGVFTPGAYSYQTTYPTHPWVWLRNEAGTWDEYDANELLPADSGYEVLAVKDINDVRQIVGTCSTPDGEVRGCIIEVDDPAIPSDNIRPSLRIESPSAGPVSGKVLIEAAAWDRESRMKKVLFKIGKTKIGQVVRPPYRMQWDFSGYAPGVYFIKAIAIDNAGNRRVKKVKVEVAVPDQVTVPDVIAVPPPVVPLDGEAVEGEGTITLVGGDFIEIDDLPVYFSEQTMIKFNEVTGFAVGLAAQYRGIRDAHGLVTATDLEIN